MSLFLKRHYHWSVALSGVDSTESIPFRDYRWIRNFEADYLSLKADPVTCMADPFLYTESGKVFLFMERQICSRKGEIVWTSSADLKEWTPLQLLLKEPFHLSYPFVFQDENQIYMIPETNQANAIRLYRFDRFPDRLVFEKELLSGRFVDSCVVKKEGTYYLFTTRVQKDHSLVAELYFSDALHGDWKPHPCSPLTADMHFARNGGSVFCHQGKMYRPVQDCRSTYGRNISLMEIDTLTQEICREHPAFTDIYDNGEKFFSFGGHHFNFLFFQGRFLAARDGARYESIFNTYLQAVIQKTKKLLNAGKA